MKSIVLIVGGGVAGLRAAIALNSFGIRSILVEKSGELGGKVKGYYRLFPDFSDAKVLVRDLISTLENSKDITVLKNVSPVKVNNDKKSFLVLLSNGKTVEVASVILACGFDVFDATKQGEYGYSVYPNVINSMELETFLDPHGPTRGRLLRPSDGKSAKRIAIIFCVGSRNKRIGNPYCSRVCCSYSTKQAIEIKEKDSKSSVTCFYMDIRTYGRGFEEMYQYAQELGVKYIRGRVSECSIQANGDIQVRAENTLLGRPVQGLFDLVSLSVGMMPFANAKEIAEIFGAKLGKDGFFLLKNEDFYPHDTSMEGVFLAGSITGLKPIRDCLLDGASVAGRVASYVKSIITFKS